MIAVLAPEPIRPRMAGMGIRALELARVLAREFETRLLVPNDPEEAREAAGDLEVAAARTRAAGASRAGREGGSRLGARGECLVSRGPGNPRRRRSLRSVPDREPPLRADARRGHGASRPGHARSRARPRRFLPVRVFRAAALLRRGALRARAGSALRNFPDDPALRRPSRDGPFRSSRVAGLGSSRRRPAGRGSARGRPARPLRRNLRLVRPGAAAVRLAGGPETRSRRAASLLREPEPGYDAPGRFRGRASRREGDRSRRPVDRVLTLAALRVARRSLRRRGSRRLDRLGRPGDRARVPHAAARRGLGRRALRGRRGRRARARARLSRRGDRVRSRRARSGRIGIGAAPRRPAAESHGEAARTFAAERTWGSVAAPLRAWARNAPRGSGPASADGGGRGGWRRRLPPRADLLSDSLRRSAGHPDTRGVRRRRPPPRARTSARGARGSRGLGPRGPDARDPARRQRLRRPPGRDPPQAPHRAPDPFGEKRRLRVRLPARSRGGARPGGPLRQRRRLGAAGRSAAAGLGSRPRPPKTSRPSEARLTDRDRPAQRFLRRVPDLRRPRVRGPCRAAGRGASRGRPRRGAPLRLRRPDGRPADGFPGVRRLRRRLLRLPRRRGLRMAPVDLRPTDPRRAPRRRAAPGRRDRRSPRRVLARIPLREECLRDGVQELRRGALPESDARRPDGLRQPGRADARGAQPGSRGAQTRSVRRRGRALLRPDALRRLRGASRGRSRSTIR